MNKKIHFHLLSLLVVFILGTLMFAANVNAEAYFKIDGCEMDDQVVSCSMGSNFIGDKEFASSYINKTGKFEFGLQGFDLVADKNYEVTLKSDYINETKTYTGTQLMNIVGVSIANAKSTIDLQVKEKDTDNYINYKYERVCGGSDPWCVPVNYYDLVALYFDNTQDLSKVESYFATLVKDGKIKTNSLKLDEQYLESSITVGLSKLYDIKDFDVYGYSYQGDNKLNITEKSNTRHTKEFDVEWEYATGDSKIKEKIDGYASKFDFDNSNIEENLFPLVDLENLNYKYATLQNPNDIDVINSIINYTSAIHNYFDNDNISLVLDTRAGWDEDFTTGGFGFLNILYNDIVYAVAEPVGVKQINVIYVPDGTEKTRDAYIAAAKKRIEEYLTGVKVEITYGGLISSIDTSDWIYPLDKLIDESKTTGEYYNVKLNDSTFKFFIEEGTNKMNVPYMNTKDMTTNIYVTSSSFEAPLDSKLSVNILDKDSNEYKELLKKLKLTDGKAIDLKLYSDTTNTYVTKLSDGKFRVYVPIEENQANSSFVAYYYKDDDTVEKYDVKIENGYAVFETNHFSTYVLNEVKNPNTIDNIKNSVLLLLLSLSGIILINCMLKSKTR